LGRPRRRLAMPSALLPLLALPAAARAGQPADQASIWTFQVENDAVSTLQGTSDQYYTSGLRLGWTSGQDQLPDSLAGVGRMLWGDGHQRVSIDISQSIFTPRDTQISPPNPNDRPYAGWLNATFSLLHDTQTTQDSLGISLGWIGPGALGEEVQNGFHHLIGDTPNKGWSYQLKNEPAIEAYGQHTWRLPIVSFAGLETDALPGATIGIGTVRDYVQASTLLRIGQGLTSDFGPARIMPGINGSDAFTTVRPIAWYIFGGGDGQAVAHDEFIEGTSFRAPSPSVPLVWYVGEIEAGVAVIWHGVRLSYTQTWQTQEFRGQKGGLFNFGSFALSARF